MDNIHELIKNKAKQAEQEPEKTRGGITSQRSYHITKLIEFMGEDKPTDEELALGEEKGKQKQKERIQWRMKYWLGRTKGITPEKILDLMKQAESGRNPQALLNWLIKNHGKKNSND